MKAIIQTEYGSPDKLHISDVPKPVPGDDDVLIRVHAAAVNYSTMAMTYGKPFIIRMMTGGMFKPAFRTNGAEIAGVVEETGAWVTKFHTGDEVFADLSWSGRGGYADYVSVSESVVALKPHNLSFEETAGIPEAAIVALQGLRNAGGLKAGQHVLINGASGGIGTHAVQLAKHFQAEVTAVCGPKNIEMVKSIGADHVIDYTKEDFTRTGMQYDLILAVRGGRSVFDYARALKPGGACIVAGGTMSQIFQTMLLGWIPGLKGNRKFKSLIIRQSVEDLNFLKESAEAGHLKTVVDRIYPFDETAKAIEYYSSGHSRGKVIIRVKEEDHS